MSEPANTSSQARSTSQNDTAPETRPSSPETDTAGSSSHCNAASSTCQAKSHPERYEHTGDAPRFLIQLNPSDSRVIVGACLGPELYRLCDEWSDSFGPNVESSPLIITTLPTNGPSRSIELNRGRPPLVSQSQASTFAAGGGPASGRAWSRDFAAAGEYIRELGMSIAPHLRRTWPSALSSICHNPEHRDGYTHCPVSPKFTFSFEGGPSYRTVRGGCAFSLLRDRHYFESQHSNPPGGNHNPATTITLQSRDNPELILYLSKFQTATDAQHIFIAWMKTHGCEGVMLEDQVGLLQSMGARLGDD